jgi:hypothetical protein
MNNRLRLISGSKPLLLNSTDGQETLAGAADLFRYIDSNFEHWNCNMVGPPTQEAAVQAHEIARDSKAKKRPKPDPSSTQLDISPLFSSSNHALERLASA